MISRLITRRFWQLKRSSRNVSASDNAKINKTTKFEQQNTQTAQNPKPTVEAQIREAAARASAYMQTLTTRHYDNKDNAEHAKTAAANGKQETQDEQSVEKLPSKAELLVRNGLHYIEDISHLSEVREAQNKVLDIKDRLRKCGDTKREIQRKQAEVRQEIQRLYRDMKFVDSKAGDAYLHLVQKEVELYRKESDLQLEFKLADEEESKLFNDFSIAINESYEKEKTHANFIKVWGVIGTLLASTITLVVSLITHYRHQAKFERMPMDFRREVNAAIEGEIAQTLKSLQRDMHVGLNRIAQMQENYNNLLKSVNAAQKSAVVPPPTSVVQLSKEVPRESWGSFLHRYTSWTYSWALPKR